MTTESKEQLLETAAPPKLVVEGVTKRFKAAKDHVHALENVSLSVKEVEYVLLVGPSVCSKSTLLKLIARLDFPYNGTIMADGKPVTGPGSDRMMMFQENALFPWLNVIQNILFGLRLKQRLNNKER